MARVRVCADGSLTGVAKSGILIRLSIDNCLILGIHGTWPMLPADLLALVGADGWDLIVEVLNRAADSYLPTDGTVLA